MATFSWAGACRKSGSVLFSPYIADRLPSEWFAPSTGAAYIASALSGGARYSLMTMGGSGSSFGLRLDTSPTGDGRSAGPDFLPAVESGLRIQFTHATAGTLTSTGGTRTDTAEPYGFAPSDQAASRRWFAAVSNGDNITITLTYPLSVNRPIGATVPSGTGVQSAAVTLKQPLAFSAFDQTGKAVDVAALIVRSHSTALYADSRRGGSDTPLAGELRLDGKADITRIFRTVQGGQQVLRFNDNNVPSSLDLSAYFGPGGDGAGQTFTVITDGGEQAVSIDNQLSSNRGGNFFDLTLPTAMRTLIDGIDVGDRFIVAIWKAAPVPVTQPIGAVDPSGVGRQSIALGLRIARQPIGAVVPSGTGRQSAAVTLRRRDARNQPIGAVVPSGMGAQSIALTIIRRLPRPIGAIVPGGRGEQEVSLVIAEPPPEPSPNLWNDPARWYAGMVVGAALLNRELRDQMLAIQAHDHSRVPGGTALTIEGLVVGQEAEPFTHVPFDVPSDTLLGFRTVGYGNGPNDCVAGNHGHGPNGEVRA